MDLRQKAYSIFVLTLIIISCYVIIFIPYLVETIIGIKEAKIFKHFFPIHPENLYTIFTVLPIILFILETILQIMILFMKKFEQCGMISVPTISIIVTLFLCVSLSMLSSGSEYEYNEYVGLSERIEYETKVCFFILKKINLSYITISLK